MTFFVSGMGPASIAAWANHDGSQSAVGNFEIDGNFLTDANPGAFDWDTVGAQSAVDGPIRSTPDDASNSQTDNVFGGGSKEQEPNKWTFESGPKPPGKDDLTRIYYASRIVNVSGTNTAYLWLGFERLEVEGAGDAHVNFELNRSTDTVVNGEGETIPKRTPGDLLVIYDYSGGTGPVNVEIRLWSGTPLGGSWGSAQSLPSGSWDADINIGSVSRPGGGIFGNGTIDDRRFGEVGLNLTAIFNGAVPACPGFAQFWAKSRSSGESFNSQLKDLVEPEGINLSTCPDLHVTKSASTATVNAGDTYTYTITATNDGVAAASNVTVTDNLDDDLVVLGATYDNNPGAAGGTGNCNSVGAGNAITCNVGTLAASDGNSTGDEPDTAVVSISVRAPKEACGVVLNRAHVASASEPDNLDNDNDSAQVSVTVICGSIRVEKTADDNSVSAGDSIGYLITVTNDGPGRADNVVLTDTLPTNSGLSWSIAGGTGAASCGIASGVLTCNFGSLNDDESRTVHITSPTTAATCGTVSNTASVTTSNDGSDSDGPVTITVLCPDVHVLKTADDGTISAGDTASFTITVSNDGQGVAKGVTLSDPLPAGIAWNEDSAYCSISSNTLTCNFGDLNPGATRVVHVSGATDSADCTVLENTATVAATNESTSDAADNTGSASITVLCASVTIDKVADDDTVSAGEDIGFLITVTNSGLGRADNVTLTDTLPTDAGLSWSIDGGTGAASCSIAGGVLTCNFGSLDGGVTKTVHISSPTTPATCGEVDNSASVTTSNDGSAQVGPVTITVLCPDVDVDKDADASSVNAGTAIGFTITVHNGGLGQAFDVELSDDLPDGLTWVIDGGTGAAQCSIASGTLTCDFGTMNAGATKTVHIAALTTAADCGTINNTATVSVSNDDVNPSSDSINVACPLIGIVKSGPQQAHIGDEITYTMVVTNEGTVALENVALTDPMCNAAPVFVGGDGDNDDLLDLSEVWTYTCKHVVTAADGDPVPNTATVTGDSVIDDANEDVEADASWSVDIVHPAISIEKTASPISGTPGTEVTYSYLVTNTGDTPLINIVVTDDKLGTIGTIASLGVGESVTLTKTTVLQAAGSITNIGTATGTDDVVPRKTVTDSDDAVVTIVLGRVILPRTGSNRVEGAFELGILLVIVGGFLVWIPRRRMPVRR